MADDQEKQQRIGSGTAMLMLVLAVALDIVGGVLPFIDIVIDVFFTFVYWLWFMMRGASVGFASPKRAGVYALSVLGEYIDGIDILPLWTLGILLIISMIRLEDRTGVKTTLLIPGRVSGVKEGVRKAARTAKMARRGPEYQKEVARRMRNINRIRAAKNSSPSLGSANIAA